MNAPAAGTDQAPATSGESPRTAWRYWARNSSEPKLMKKPTVFAASAALNPRDRKSRRSSSGSTSRRWRLEKTVMTTRPRTIAAGPVAPQPSRARCLMPKTIGRMPAIARPTLTRSSRPASGVRYSGSRRRPSTRTPAITGTAGRNTELHEKCSSKTPPTRGPIAAPEEKLAIQTPTAKVRWRGSANSARTSDSVEGASVAPAAPSRARAAMSMPTLVAAAASVEARAKVAAPIMSSRRRPIRSPRVPMVTSRPAVTKP